MYLKKIDSGGRLHIEIIPKSEIYNTNISLTKIYANANLTFLVFFTLGYKMRSHSVKQFKNCEFLKCGRVF